MNLVVAVFGLAVYIICHSNSVLGFLPSSESGGRRSDFTHVSITEDGIYKAVAEVIIEKVKPGIYDTDSHTDKVKEYFNSDAWGRLQFQQTVDYIVDKVNLAQRQYSTDACRTMNCEQISSGNILLQSLKFNIIQNSQTTAGDWAPIRDLLGEYLFTMQEFYSNTNWVEMFASRPCRELGVKRRLPFKLSSVQEATCTSCNYSKDALLSNSCSNNIIQNGRLTSGYTSIQNVVKPFRKCSHGGPSDAYKDVVAIGGINKETSDPELSPHYHLHQVAGRAAVQATYDLLVGEDTGLLSAIGLDRTMSLLGMDHNNLCYSCFSPSLSLVFVIGGTGSMAEEILKTSTYSVAIVNKGQGSTSPFNYILSTFNDPETRVFVTMSGVEIKKQLQSLKAHGSGDYPEMVLHGMVNAMKLAEQGSCIFFFTDTDVKDLGLLSDVIELINNKSLHLLQFVIGNSSTPHTANDAKPHHMPRFAFTPPNVHCIPNGHNLSGERRKRSMGSIFDQIAAQTHSTVIQTSHSTLGNTLGQIIQENMNIHTLGVASFEMDADVRSFPVDRCLSLFTVSLEGNGCSNVALLRPDGSNQPFTGNATKDIIDRKTTILSVHNPLHGMWQLKNIDKSHCHVTVSGSGCIDFTYKILEDIRGVKYPISGTSPVAGNNYTLSVSVRGIPQNLGIHTNITQIYLKKPDGRLLTSLPVSDSSRTSTRSVFTDVTFWEPFYVGIKGLVDMETMTREILKTVTPVKGKIEFVPSSNSLVYNQEVAVSVRITNAGVTQQTFDVAAADTAGFVTSVIKHVTLDSKQTKTMDFHITAIPPATYTKLTITLLTEGASSRIDKHLMVSTVNPPDLKVVNRSENCKKASLNIYNCSHQQWEMVVSIVFTANMTRLYCTPVSSTLIFTYHQDSADKNKYLATLKGNCCTYQLSVIAHDSAGNSKTLAIKFSGENKFNTDVGANQWSKQTGKSKEGSSSNTWPAVGGAVGAAVALGASVLGFKKYKSMNKVESDLPDAITDQMQNESFDKNRKKKFTMF
ncbi:von Willebrand factor A domain-containing protein 7-like [Ostrea edulis]|uniref:von Willebrand factor A domain-containing protein 7-like n=1 Tax=Ostrea edulis TaxID=37623 RepID=UPI0024AEC491|nr:von Willebrand factor A domain-containing protein 7-like [Ostrea edulis]